MYKCCALYIKQLKAGLGENKMTGTILTLVTHNTFISKIQKKT